MATTAGTPVAAFEDADRRLAGVQWHPEVLHTEHGQRGARALPARHRRLPADLDDASTSSRSRSSGSARRSATGRAICGLSGGVDSAVAAALVQRAIGDRLTCVFVDHGLLRKGEAEQVERDFVAATGVDARRRRRGRAVPRRAGRGHRPRGEAQDHRPRVHPGVRGRPRARSSAAARRRSRSRSWSRARSTPTSSSPAAAPAPPTSSPTTTSAACPTTCSSSSSSRCARCSRTRCARSASSSACRPRSSGASRSPGPASASGSSARSPRAARRSCARPTPSPARS